MNSSEKSKPDWGQPVVLTPEQIILWLEGHRQWMQEVWKANPELRKQWEKLNGFEKE